MAQEPKGRRAARRAAKRFHNRPKEILVHVWYFGAKDNEMDVKLLIDDGKGSGVKPLQEWVGGYFEYHPLYVQGTIQYSVYMNENGRNEKLPVNKNFAKAFPSFSPVFGNVVVAAINVNTGRKMDLTIKPENLARKSAQFLKERAKKQAQWEQQFEAMGGKIIRM